MKKWNPAVWPPHSFPSHLFSSYSLPKEPSRPLTWTSPLQPLRLRRRTSFPASFFFFFLPLQLSSPFDNDRQKAGFFILAARVPECVLTATPQPPFLRKTVGKQQFSETGSTCTWTVPLHSALLLRLPITSNKWQSRAFSIFFFLHPPFL